MGVCVLVVVHFGFVHWKGTEERTSSRWLAYHVTLEGTCNMGHLSPPLESTSDCDRAFCITLHFCTLPNDLRGVYIYNHLKVALFIVCVNSNNNINNNVYI